MNLFQDISKIKDLLSNYFKDYKTLEKQREGLAQERDIIANLPKTPESLIDEYNAYIDARISKWREQFTGTTKVRIASGGTNSTEGRPEINEWFKGIYTGQFAPEVNPGAMFFFFAPRIKEILAEEIMRLPKSKDAIANADRIKKLADLDKQIATLDSQLAGLDKTAKENGLVKPLGAGYLVVNLEAEDFVDRGGDPNELMQLKKLQKRYAML